MSNPRGILVRTLPGILQKSEQEKRDIDGVAGNGRGCIILIGNNGWLISKTSPQDKPSFELNKQIVQKAEHLGLDFALSMVKHRGFGGDTEFWDYNLESFTLMAGIAAVTERIKLVASTAILTLPPAVVARMARTVDSIAPGRVGVNIVTGWAPNEYTQMGIWPGNEYFGYRYDDASEYCEVMRQLWAEGSSDFKGEHFQMEDCMMKPVPENKIEIVAAGQPERGMRFSAEYADYSFVMGRGINTPTDFAPVCAELVAAAEKTGSRCRGLCPVHGDRGRDRREGPGQVEPVSRRRRHEGAVLHGRAGGAGFSGQRPVHRKADQPARGGGQLQHGHDRRVLRKLRADAGRGHAQLGR